MEVALRYLRPLPSELGSETGGREDLDPVAKSRNLSVFASMRRRNRVACFGLHSSSSDQFASGSESRLIAMSTPAWPHSIRKSLHICSDCNVYSIRRYLSGIRSPVYLSYLAR